MVTLRLRLADEDRTAITGLTAAIDRLTETLKEGENEELAALKTELAAAADKLQAASQAAK